ncbi:MAG: histidine--tRNA ligase [Actinobacteria bacterium]|nr:histidine--tRNA ligase [Actinomycetota bacterium]MCL6105548.1 histidine--tRNA ligase [Actinomycetota bacterium]
MNPLSAPIGTKDILAPESGYLELLIHHFQKIVRRAGYRLVVTPVFEDVQLFTRGIGSDNELVTKEMYEFLDKSGRNMALKPEGTASVIRAFIQHHLSEESKVFKAWYCTPVFRYERPQAGRLRQHHQLGLEALGTADPELDIEVVGLAASYLGSLGLKNYTLNINSMGDLECRMGFIKLLNRFLDHHADELCNQHCKRYRLNPLRVFDCKKQECVDVMSTAPKLKEHLCDKCGEHFATVTQGLTDLGFVYEISDKLVRGFDYYTRTTFEFNSNALNTAQNAIGGGGRYDGLVEALGGQSTPGVGFGIGLERLLLASSAEGIWSDTTPSAFSSVDIFVIGLESGSDKAVREVVFSLRNAGYQVDQAFGSRSLKAQLRTADRSGALVALIIGPKEVEESSVTLKPLRSSESQSQLPREKLLEKMSEIYSK